MRTHEGGVHWEYRGPQPPRLEGRRLQEDVAKSLEDALGKRPGIARDPGPRPPSKHWGAAWRASRFIPQPSPDRTPKSRTAKHLGAPGVRNPNPFVARPRHAVRPLGSDDETAGVVIEDAVAYFLDLRLRVRGNGEAQAIVDRRPSLGPRRPTGRSWRAWRARSRRSRRSWRYGSARHKPHGSTTVNPYTGSVCPDTDDRTREKNCWMREVDRGSLGLAPPSPHARSDVGRLGEFGAPRRVVRRDHRVVAGEAELLSVAFRGEAACGEVALELLVAATIHEGRQPIGANGSSHLRRRGVIAPRPRFGALAGNQRAVNGLDEIDQFGFRGPANAWRPLANGRNALQWAARSLGRCRGRDERKMTGAGRTQASRRSGRGWTPALLGAGAILCALTLWAGMAY